MSSAVSSRDGFTGKVGVISLVLDGRGDVATGRILTNLVKAILPNATVHFSYDKCVLLPFESVPLSQKSSVVVFTEQDKKDWGVEDIALIYKRIKEGEFGLVILFPPTEDRHIPAPILKGKMPIVKISEYSVFYPSYQMLSDAKESGFYFLGSKTFTEGQKSISELGFVFPEELYEYGLVHQNDKAAARLANLEHFPPELTQLILGTSYSEAAVKAFDTTSKLYSGYCHDIYYAHDFILSICSMEEGGTGDVTIWLTNDLSKVSAKKPFTEEETDYLKYVKKPENHKAIFQNKFKSVQIYSLNEKNELAETGKMTFGEKAKGERKLRIIFKPLEPKPNLMLDKSSEKETIRTGPVSLFEAYSLRKVSAFCISLHLSGLVGDLLTNANKVNPLLNRLLTAGYVGKSFNLQAALSNYGKGKDYLKMDHSEIREGMATLFKQGKTPLIQILMNLFITHLHDKHNFKDSLAKLVDQKLPKTS